VDRGGEDELVVHDGPERLPGPRRALEVHVSLDRLVVLGARLDYRLLAADTLTLYWRPAGFRLGWLPSFARELGAVLWAAAGLVAFHLGKVVTFRRR